MQTIILPGGSVSNKEWLEETAKSLQVDGIIRPIYWDHWEDSEKNFDQKQKAQLIARHSKGDKLNIIAKSIGSLVAAYIILQIPEQINKVIFCGIPLNDISSIPQNTIKNAILKVSPKQIICFQNVADPHATYDEVKKYLPEGITLISKDRSDHHYPFYSEFNQFLTQL